MLKKSLSIVLALATVLSFLIVIPAAGAESTNAFGDYSYTLNADGTVTISGYNGTAENLSIPEKIGGKVVSAIGKDAFYNNRDLHSVKIPNGVKTIERAAFYFCSNLLNAELPKTLTKIDSLAFVGCGIGSVQIPAATTDISYSAFWMCDNMESFKVDSNNKFYSAYNGNLYDKAQTTLISVAGGRDSLSLPKSATQIGLYSCYGNKNLVTVDIPESVKEIGEGAFIRCPNLAFVKIPSGVKEIYSSVFENCDALASIIIPAGVTGIYSKAFAKCDNLKEVVIPDSVKVIEDDVFLDSPNVVICCNSGSYAQSFAKKNNIKASVTAVKLLTPSVTATQTSYLSVTVKWNAVDGAKGYKIYRREDGGKWKAIGFAYGKTSFNDKVSQNKTYFYTVRAFTDRDDQSTYSDHSVTGAKICTVIEKPYISYCNSTDYNKISIKWTDPNKNVASFVNGYNVYRKIPGGSWKLLSTVGKSTKSFTDSTAVTGQKYYYLVRAYIKSGKSTYMSAYSSTGVLAVSYTKAPALKSAKSVSNGIKVNWSAVNGASGYRIYRKTSSGWQIIGNVNSKTTSFVDKSAKKGTQYTYTVKAYRTVNKKNIFGFYDTTGIKGKR